MRSVVGRRSSSSNSIWKASCAAEVHDAFSVAGGAISNPTDSFLASVFGFRVQHNAHNLRTPKAAAAAAL